MAINANLLPNGFGLSTGDPLLISEPWYTNGIALYVDSVTGDDTFDGLDPARPFATFAAAYAEAVAGDYIILAGTHDETVTSAVSLDKAGLVVVGAGSSGGTPTAKMSINAAAASLFEVGANNVEIRNILFPTSVQSNSLMRVKWGAGEHALVGGLISGCKFESTVNDQGSGLNVVDCEFMSIEGCHFISTDTTAVATPALSGLVVSDAAPTKLIISNTIFDGGTVGYQEGIGADLSAATMLNCEIQGVSLLRGSDMSVLAASSGRINITTSTGSARVIFS